MIVSRSILRKALLLVLLMISGGLHLSLSASPLQPITADNAYTLGQTQENIPSWQDLGLEDLIVNASEGSVEAPQSFQNLNDEHLLHESSVAIPTHNARPQALHSRASDYYVYFIYRLRL